MNSQPHGIYLHVPFCITKCPYCNFTTSLWRGGEGFRAYSEGLARELRYYNEKLDFSRVRTAYIGGGTPTCFSGSQLSWLLNELKSFISLDHCLEFTVEANPVPLTEEQLAVLYRAGVNRLSLGVQSFHPGLLKAMGRRHTTGDILDAVRKARAAGFENLNIDLIYGLPNQDANLWRKTLEAAVALETEHLSIYGLQVEPGTPWGRLQRRGGLDLPGEEQQLEMFLQAGDMLVREGYCHYEIANFSRQGRQSRHNLAYWLNLDYLGLGPGASSHLGRCRWSNVSDLMDYLSAGKAGEAPVGEKENLDTKTAMGETIFLALRTSRGLNLAHFNRIYHCDPREIYREQFEFLKSQGLVVVEKGWLRLTRKGLPLANEVFVNFV